jgi:hypothetical protein
MQPELFVGSIRRPQLEHASQNLKLQRPLPFLLKWQHELEDSMLLRASLDNILLRNNLKRELRIFDHNPCHPNSARAPAPHHLHHRAMIIGRSQERTSILRFNIRALSVCKT